ncbi:MAG: type II toxin-antitoxin system RelE/ParE family toxin [Cyclobacteriaceae bacterium]|nr:type II toxin-antitoxin system RelE/ParE family toxin [Cyclobacteriaceae bacterium]
MRYFETVFLDEVVRFFDRLDQRLLSKILYNIELAEHTYDSRLFKKIGSDIWEFRTRYSGIQVRLLAFWDKRDNDKTMVIATSGFIKKNKKIPIGEIKKAIGLKEMYFNRI